MISCLVSNPANFMPPMRVSLFYAACCKAGVAIAYIMNSAEFLSEWSRNKCLLLLTNFWAEWAHFSTQCSTTVCASMFALSLQPREPKAATQCVPRCYRQVGKVQCREDHWTETNNCYSTNYEASLDWLTRCLHQAETNRQQQSQPPTITFTIISLRPSLQLSTILSQRTQLKSDTLAVLAVLPRYPRYYRGNEYNFYGITVVLGPKYVGFPWGWEPVLRYYHGYGVVFSRKWKLVGHVQSRMYINSFTMNFLWLFWFMLH